MALIWALAVLVAKRVVAHALTKLRVLCEQCHVEPLLSFPYPPRFLLASRPEAILAHFAKHGVLAKAHYRPAARAPPAYDA